MSEIDKWDEVFEQRLTGFLKEHLAELLTSEGLSRPCQGLRDRTSGAACEGGRGD